MSDSSIRTNPAIDEPSNRVRPSSASANWRWGTSTFLMTPRMSVNCRRMNFTPARSAASRISAFWRAVSTSDLPPRTVVASTIGASSVRPLPCDVKRSDT
jgi:hypothetical protein